MVTLYMCQIGRIKIFIAMSGKEFIRATGQPAKMEKQEDLGNVVECRV